VCKEYPYALDHSSYSSGNISEIYRDYYNFSGTARLMRVARNPSIPWAPACVSYGFPGDLLLGRLRGSIKVLGSGNLLFISLFPFLSFSGG
jgi:hypothetical protein